MKNGTLSNKLILVNSESSPGNAQDFADDSGADYAYRSSPDSASAALTPDVRTALLILVTVSAACATAAVASGTYALWLSRQQAAHKTLTNVTDILTTCQKRMAELETEVRKLPNRA